LLGETLRWESPERFGPSDDAWTVRLSARRDAGRRVTLCVAGEAEFRVEALRTGDLLELLAGFCETFPLDDGVLHAESDRSSDGPPDVAIAGVIGPRTSGLETTRRAA
jgi:hypothetical protein